MDDRQIRMDGEIVKKTCAVLALLFCVVSDADARERPVNEAEQRCLARAIYFEARGMPERSREAVAHAVLNRVGVRGNNVCEVISDRIGNRPQFDFMRHQRNPREMPQWEQAMAMAERMLRDRPEDFTRGATSFFNPRLARPNPPAWATPNRIVWRDSHHVFVRVPIQPIPGLRLASVETD